MKNTYKFATLLLFLSLSWTSISQICSTCPNFDFAITPSTTWQLHSSSHVSNGCKMYSVDVVTGNQYTFKTGCGDGALTDYDSYIELSNASCTYITGNDDGCSGASSIVTWTATYTGTAYVKVRGFSSSYGNYTLAYSFFDCTNIPSPVTIAATNTTNAGFTANWNSSVGATGYYIDVATDNLFTNMVSGYSNLSCGNTTSKSITNLICNTLYYYRVRAITSCGTSPNSNISSATTLSTISSSIANAGTNISGTGFTSNWTSVSGATTYYLDVATDVNFTSMVTGYSNLNIGNFTNKIITGLTCGTTYYYRVRAGNACGSSINSNTISVTTSNTPSSIVANSATNISTTSFTASWSLSTQATTYYLDVATDANFTNLIVGYSNLNVGNFSSKSVIGLTCGTTYYYRVRASNVCGTSVNSNTISTTTFNTPNSTVANTATNISATGFTATWSISAQASTYYLDVATDVNFTNLVVGYSNLNVGNTTTAYVSGLNCNTAFYYRVRASNSCGTSVNSNVISLTTTTCICVVCPNFDFAITPTSTWQLHSSSHVSNGCKMYSVAVVLGNQYTFKTGCGDGALASYDSYIELNNSTCTYITGNDDGCGSASTVTWTATYTGTAYLKVRGYSSSSGTYTLAYSFIDCSNIPSPITIAATNTTNAGFTANWNSSVGATGYYIDVATDNLFANMVSGYSNLSCGNTTSKIITNLTCNTVYYYRVRAITSCGTSPNSNISSSTTLSTISSSIANAGTSISGTGFTSNWTSVAGATNYYLDVATDVNFTNLVAGYSNLNVGNFTSKIVTGLTCGTNYYYQVRASNLCDTSINSNTISVTTFNTPNATPANAATSISTSSFTASWSLISQTTAYYLDVATDANFTNLVTGYSNLNVGNVSSKNVTGLTCGTTYYYQVRASNSCGTSVNSNTVSVTTFNTPNSNVANAATSVATTSFTASWSQSTQTTAYYLDVATDVNFINLVTGYSNLNVGNFTSKNVTGLTCGTNYYYRVRASNTCGSSVNSNTISVTTFNTPNSNIANAATSVSTTSFTASWSQSSQTTAYYLDVATDANFTNLVTGYSNLNVGNFTSKNVTGLTCGTNYYYRVRASNSCGSSVNSNTISVTTLNTPAATVANSATSISESGFTASWSPSSQASTYYLDVATDVNFTNLVVGYSNLNIGNSTATFVSGLNCNTAYYYRVRAFNSCGTSVNSNVVTLTTLPCICLVCPNFDFAITPTSTWQLHSSSHVTNGCKMYSVAVVLGNEYTFKTGCGDGALANYDSYIELSNATCTSITGNDDGCGSASIVTWTATYTGTAYVKVRGYSSNSGNYTLAYSYIDCSNIPSPVSTIATTVSTNGFTANWNTSVGATNYYIDVATDNTFTNMVSGYTNLSEGNATSQVISNLNCNTTYYYRVRSFTSCGTSSNSNIISVTTLSSIGNTTATAGTSINGTSFTANWTSVSGATTYYIDVATNLSFTSLVTGYSNLNVGNFTNKTITGLTCGTNYYYRVRASNVCGTSGNSSIISVTTFNTPASIVVNSATSISASGFTASWSLSSQATTYFLDVATDNNFTNLVAGYSNLNVGNTTSTLVYGLNCSTAYYYRVRASNSCGTSPNSNLIMLNTGTCICTTCPNFDQSLSPNLNWQIISSNIVTGGCKIYKIQVVSGVNYIFKTGCGNGATSNYDTYLVLKNNSCVDLMNNDNGCSLQSIINWTANYSGFVYLNVSGTGTSSGNYSLAYKSSSCIDNLTVNTTICSGESVLFGQNTYTESGTYLNTLTNQFGCDSNVTLILNVLNYPTATLVSQNGLLVSSPNDESMYDYSWISCDNNQLLNGTNSTLQPASLGNYAVIISNSNSCTDTSDCLFFDPYASVTQNEVLENEIEIYPIPSDGYLNILSQKELKDINVRFIDANGRLLFSKNYFSGKEFSVDISEYSFGFYYLEIINNENVLIRKKILKN